MEITAILIGMGGELDRVTFKSPRGDNFDLDDLAEAVRQANGSPWILGNGDSIRIIEE